MATQYMTRSRLMEIVKPLHRANKGSVLTQSRTSLKLVDVNGDKIVSAGKVNPMRIKGDWAVGIH